jgi:glycosyltransferase involved in cell wall biosynthesis
MEKMRIALVTQYFWPESFSINDLVRALVAQGHAVEVFTGKPNYPDGRIFSGYRQEGCMTELFESTVPVHRVPLAPRGKGGAKGLIRNYLSFVMNGLRHFPSQARGKDFDAIFVFTLSPITSVIPAIYLKWILRKKMTIWVLDLWPESLAATGFIKNRFVLGAVGLVVRAIYACSDRILVQSHAFVDAVAKYADRKKIVYYPNSHVDIPQELSTDTALDVELLQVLERDFCIVFTGNLGTAQDVETLVAAADRLRHIPDFKLVLVGSGSMSNWLAEQKAALGLDNLILAGRYPAQEMPQFLTRAQALLVSLKKAEIFAQTVPAKIQSYLAAGKPIIAALDGEGARVVLEARAGLACGAENVAGLVQAIEQLHAMSNGDRAEFGRAGREYFLKNFETNAQAAKLATLLLT